MTAIARQATDDLLDVTSLTMESSIERSGKAVDSGTYAAFHTVSPASCQLASTPDADNCQKMTLVETQKILNLIQELTTG